MPEIKRPLKVFLCHADRDPVRALYARLTKDGVDAWLTRRGIENPRLSAWKPCGLGMSPNGLPRTEQGISIPLTHAHADRDPRPRTPRRDPSHQRRRGRMARQRETPPRVGLGIGNPQGRAQVK